MSAHRVRIVSSSDAIWQLWLQFDHFFLSDMACTTRYCFAISERPSVRHDVVLHLNECTCCLAFLPSGSGIILHRVSKKNTLCSYYLVKHSPILIILADAFLKDVGINCVFNSHLTLLLFLHYLKKKLKVNLMHSCVSFLRIYFSLCKYFNASDFKFLTVTSITIIIQFIKQR